MDTSGSIAAASAAPVRSTTRSTPRRRETIVNFVVRAMMNGSDLIKQDLSLARKHLLARTFVAAVNGGA
jgi:hypothetical protein